jgi:hypothetical protein
VGRIRKRELAEVISMWKESFRGELGIRGMDLGDLEPIFRFLLSLRRMPLALLHRLGVPVEVWVLRVGGRPVGSVGQIGYRIPYIIGLVVAEGKRSLRLVRILDQGVTEGLRNAGYALMRALVPQNHPIAKLARKLGWEILGETRQFVLSLTKVDVAAESPELKVGPLSFRRENILARTFSAEGNVKALLSVERNYGSTWARLFGFRERVLAVEKGGAVLGLARVSWNVYQPICFMGVPLLQNETSYELLLIRALTLFRHFGKEVLHLDLWEDQHRAIELLEDLGAADCDHWTYMIKRL